MVRAALALLLATGLYGWQDVEPFRAQADLVRVEVAVLGPDGRPVRGLTPADFRVTDNGAAAPVALFSADAQPIAASVVLDRSGSMLIWEDQLIDGLKALVGALRDDDRVALLTLTHTITGPAGAAALRRLVSGKLPLDMGTPLWSGIDRAMIALGGVQDRGVVILCSDGLDTLSTAAARQAREKLHAAYPRFGDYGEVTPATRETVIADATRAGVTIDAFSYEDGALASLKALASDSGGRLTVIHDESGLPALLRALVDELRFRYLLGFTPRTFDGRVHSLSVKVARPHVTVRARRSYLAVR